MKISGRVALEFSATSRTGDVLGTEDLMNEKLRVVFTVEVTASAVEMIGICLFVLLQVLFGLEVLEAVFVCAFDFVAHFVGVVLLLLRVEWLYLLRCKLWDLTLLAGLVFFLVFLLPWGEVWAASFSHENGVSGAWDGTVSRAQDGMGSGPWDRGRPLGTRKHCGQLASATV